MVIRPILSIPGSTQNLASSIHLEQSPKCRTDGLSQLGRKRLTTYECAFTKATAQPDAYQADTALGHSMLYAAAMDMAFVWVKSSVEILVEFGALGKEDKVLECVRKWETGGTNDMGQTKGN